MANNNNSAQAGTNTAAAAPAANTAVQQGTTTAAAPAANNTAKKDKRVEVYVPRGGANDDPNLFISVNGMNYLLPKGKTSLVPPHIKAEIERCIRAKAKADDDAAAMAAAAQK